jgi:hypothetical protein
MSHFGGLRHVEEGREQGQYISYFFNILINIINSHVKI